MHLHATLDDNAREVNSPRPCKGVFRVRGRSWTAVVFPTGRVVGISSCPSIGVTPACCKIQAFTAEARNSRRRPVLNEGGIGAPPHSRLRPVCTEIFNKVQTSSNVRICSMCILRCHDGCTLRFFGACENCKYPRGETDFDLRAIDAARECGSPDN